MAVRTFYWDAELKRTNGRFRALKPVPWTVGNAGDIYTADLIRYLYDDEPFNTTEGGHRSLMVGSILQTMQAGDVIAGVGSKRDVLPPASQDLDVVLYGVRGPLTLQVLEAAGYNTSTVRFQLDPGLLIGKLFPALHEVQAEPGRVTFIPHYRERPQFRSTRKYAVVDVDASPLEFGRDIARSEIVYSSSLHGVIFAHALGRPAVLVAPRTSESEFKYRDYFASVGLKWQTPLSIGASLKRAKPQLPEGISALIDGAKFPTLDELRAAKVVESR